MIPFATASVYWFALPLIAAISLVYSASRSESWRQIWRGAARLAGTILTILLVTTAVLLLVNTQL